MNERADITEHQLLQAILGMFRLKAFCVYCTCPVTISLQGNYVCLDGNHTYSEREGIAMVLNKHQLKEWDGLVTPGVYWRSHPG